jgi:biopolymer transport protein ExbB
MDLQARLTAFSLMGAEWVMWLLVALSVVGLTVVVERAIYFFSSRDDAGRLTRRLRQLLDSGDFEQVRRQLERSPGFEARIAAAALRQRCDEGPSAHGAEERIAAERSSSKLLMEEHLAFLGTLGNNAPFIGLLGTVIGIIGALRELAAGGGQVSAGLMAEIGEALVVTGRGLLVALPAVASFNLFQQLIQRRIERADALAQLIVASLKAEEQRASLREGRG